MNFTKRIAVFLFAALAVFQAGASDPQEEEEYRYVPILFTVTPSFPAGSGERTENTVFIQILMGVSTKITGLQIGTGIGVIERNSSGVQLSGIGSITGETYRGLQTGGLFTFSGGTLRGVQFSPGINIGSEHVLGFQASGLANFADGDLAGFQLSGLLNTANDVYGVQIGLINIADDVHGLQIGLINIADSYSGVPIGLINLVNKGFSALPVWYDARRFVFTGIQYGTDRLYSLLYGGVSPRNGENAIAIVAGYGMGIHAGTRLVYLDTDISVKTWAISRVENGILTGGFSLPENLVPSVRFTLGTEIGKLFGIITGMTFDLLPFPAEPGHVLASDLGEFSFSFLTTDFSVQPAWFIGLRL